MAGAGTGAAAAAAAAAAYHPGLKFAREPFSREHFERELRHSIEKQQEAEAAVPDELVDELGLYGPVERIRERYKTWADSGIGTILVGTRQPEALRLMAELAEVQPAAVAR